MKHCLLILALAPLLTAQQKSAAKQPTPTKSASKQAAKKAPPRPRYYAQLQPTTDRYKEIQQALADKGYFSGAPDGMWGPSSTEAMKRFQHDQSLTEDGKIDALSLTALGLGPRRAAGSSVPLK